MSAVYVEIVSTRGSAPRDAGTVMQVGAQTTHGTIGGGALEFEAIATARDMLRQGAPDMTRTIPLGPALGQCCGGAVTLRYSRTARVADLDQFMPPLPFAFAPQMPLWVWGAGHVGRAVVRQAAPTGAFDITWVDTTPARFPERPPKDVALLPAADMPRAVAHAPRDAHHLILTYSHDIDLKLCAALLRHGFASCGLIGSATKKSRFFNRLRAFGLDPVPITCPIGDKSRGKHPDAIAHGTLSALLAPHHHTKRTA